MLNAERIWVLPRTDEVCSVPAHHTLENLSLQATDVYLSYLSQDSNPGCLGSKH